MTKKRKSFLIHIDSLGVLDDLTDEQAGMLFRAIKSHHYDEEINLDSATKIAFSFFKNQFIRDEEKYQSTCAKRAEAGSKGGKQKVANASKSKQKVPNLADSDSKNKNDSKNKSIDFSPLSLSDELLAEVKAIRKRNKANITQRVVNSLAREFEIARNAGWSNDDILTQWDSGNWKSFKADWMKGNPSVKEPEENRQEYEPIDHHAMMMEMINDGK